MLFFKPKITKTNPYPVFLIGDKTLEAKVARLALDFKNYWFDNCFGVSHRIKNGERFKKGLWNKFLRTGMAFKVGQFIIHKILWPYSFSIFKKPEKNLKK